MGLLKIISFIINHPISKHSKVRSLCRFFWWQIRSAFTNSVYEHQFTQNSKLLISKGMTGATGNLYCGLHEYKEMLFLLHYLRFDDLFVDIGANIGSYTILASAEVGAYSYSFEPLPKTFKQLENNIGINNIYSRVSLFNMGLASKKGKLYFSDGNESVMNHVELNNSINSNSKQVEVDILDSILNSKIPNLLKIDVEGFEFDVLKGADATLKGDNLKAIIIELNGSGLNYGYKDEDIDSSLKSYGYEAYSYCPFERTLTVAKLKDFENLIYIRDIDFVRNRIVNAPKIKILDLFI